MSATHVTIVTTVFGQDRPGIIESLASVVAESGASWEESRMARLSGHFAGVVSVRVEESAAEKLEADLVALEATGFQLRVEIVREAIPTADLRSAELALVGQDRPGILREITSALAAHSVEVVRLETRCQSAPMSGEMLFEANANLLCPAGLSIDRLRETVEQIGHDLMVDVSLLEVASPD